MAPGHTAECPLSGAPTFEVIGYILSETPAHNLDIKTYRISCALVRGKYSMSTLPSQATRIFTHKFEERGGRP